eukprot:NODE_2235_length_738_cov_214.031930_g1804_i0.p1 GENE.NODE_2235_length_738_cov_214.031930_g1804_i0~~NODE_2235_length_738_cov_214.031930_g1804_i0.p1  ORF type:complete len:186 (-),score=22.60 NODE_2235_length_738_cov_214.031930_g1804_i0:123-680(-)
MDSRHGLELAGFCVILCFVLWFTSDSHSWDTIRAQKDRLFRTQVNPTSATAEPKGVIPTTPTSIVTTRTVNSTSTQSYSVFLRKNCGAYTAQMFSTEVEAATSSTEGSVRVINFKCSQTNQIQVTYDCRAWTVAEADKTCSTVNTALNTQRSALGTSIGVINSAGRSGVTFLLAVVAPLLALLAL